MTRIAIISDVHADVHALTDALLQADRLGCDAIVCAGDLVDYGRHPNETIALLSSRSIPCIRGNHDRWRLEKHAAAGSGGQSQEAVGSGPELTQDSLRFLAGLPRAWDAVIDGVRVAVRHARPRSDMEGIYPAQASPGDVWCWLEDAQADVLLVGHTHLPFTLSAVGGRGLVANPGALLRAATDQVGWMYDPESGTFVHGSLSSGGTFGVLELPTQRFTVFRAADGAEIEVPRLTVGVTDSRAR
jgi:predicted phosphodiesterase